MNAPSWTPYVAAPLAGLAYGLFARFVFHEDSGPAEGTFVTLSLAFVFLVPLAVGYLTVYLGPPERRTRGSYAVLMPWVTALSCLAAVLVTAWEGSICVVMMAPVFLGMASIGGTMAAAARAAEERRGRTYAAAALPILLLPYLAAPIEGALPLAARERVVENRVRIRAAPAEVWRNIARVPQIRPHEYRRSLVHRIGFPAPVEATLSHEGVGGVRHASFERGVVFVETVTRWEPGRALAFTIEVDPESIPPTALDPHVTVGGPYFDVLDGTYEIVPAGAGEVELRLRSTHRLGTRFNFYAALWSDLVMGQVQQNILEVVRRRSEGAAR
ncbi:MAG TPA: hypothetical protein VFX98_12910 [Longimicrobiaceae bacterium]|nr:hypothetical protein [Longimicrobiaceae bacterium]